MNCIIIDDDPVARKTLQLLCGKVEYVSVLSEYGSALEAIDVIRSRKDIDFIFLDIHMPDLNGFDFLKAMQDPPNVIFTTSDQSRAVEAFDVDAIDYLIKPVSFPRFLKAIEKLTPSIPTTRNQRELKNIDLFINADKRLTRINMLDIAVVEAKGDYILIKMADNKQHIIRSTMKNIESRLSADVFAQVHRSFIINTNKIIDIEDSSILINNQIIPISRSYKTALLSRLNKI